MIEIERLTEWICNVRCLQRELEGEKKKDISILFKISCWKFAYDAFIASNSFFQRM
jgi:hypothetical protein